MKYSSRLAITDRKFGEATSEAEILLVNQSARHAFDISTPAVEQHAGWQDFHLRGVFVRIKSLD